MGHKACLVAPWLIASAASAAANEVPLPSATEIEDFVSKNWIESYAPRLFRCPAVVTPECRLPWHGGQPPRLVSVQNVECGYYYAVPDCRFEVRFETADGSRRSEAMSDTYSRDEAGMIESVIVLVHERPGRPLGD